VTDDTTALLIYAPRGPLQKNAARDRASEDDSRIKCHTFLFFLSLVSLDLWPWHSNSG